MSSRCMWWCAVPFVLIVSGCILDDDRCGENQRELSSTFEGCVCAPGFVPNADGVGCRACGEHEEAQSGLCVCAEGFTRPSPGAACTAGSESAAVAPIPSGQDMPCTTSDDCASYDADFCAPELSGGSICLVQQCGSGVHPCQADRDCCVVTAQAALAEAEGLCVAHGMCPASVGMVVTP